MRLPRSPLVGLVVCLLFTGCGGSGGWLTVTPTAAGGGVEVTLVSVSRAEDLHPFLPPAGEHCVSYIVVARATGGGRHELRATDFRTAGGRPVDALGPCGGPQLDPTWLDRTPKRLTVTVLTPADQPEPLLIRL